MRSSRWKLLFGAAALIGAVAFAASPAWAVDGNDVPLDLFELEMDADPYDEPAAGGFNPAMDLVPAAGGNQDDWENLYNGGLNDGCVGACFEFTGITDDVGICIDDMGDMDPTNDEPANCHEFGDDVEDNPNIDRIQGDEIFVGGSSKDIDDIFEWIHKTGGVAGNKDSGDGGAVDKDDITNAYAAAYIAPEDVCVDAVGDVTACPGAAFVHMAGDLVIYYGADRIDTNGDAFLGFWFLQGEIGLNGPKSGPGFHFTGAHTLADLLVQLNFPQAAGALPLIRVLAWCPGTKSDLCNAPGTSLDGLVLIENNLVELLETDVECEGELGGGLKQVCASANDQSFMSVWPYTNKDDNEGPIDEPAFFEGGINVSKFFPQDETPCFSTFVAETRASESISSVLKDFVADDFNVCGVDVTKACVGSGTIDGSTINYSMNGTVSNTGAIPADVVLVDAILDLAGVETGDFSTIDAVCIDLDDDGIMANGGAPNGVCDVGGDDVFLALTPVSDPTLGDGEQFNLLGGQTVIWEGSFPDSAPVIDTRECLGADSVFDDVTDMRCEDAMGDPTFDENPNLGDFVLPNEVTATAFATGANITTDDALDESSADDTCSTPSNPSIDVNKDCTAAINTAGDALVVSITGTGSNDGDIPLTDVTIDDSDNAVLTACIDLDDDGVMGNGGSANGQCDAGGDDVFVNPVTGFALGVGEAFAYSGSLSLSSPTVCTAAGVPATSCTAAGDLVNEDTITASGFSVFDLGQNDAISDMDDADCADTPGPSLVVVKSCTNPRVDSGTTFLADISGTITNNGDVKITDITLADLIVTGAPNSAFTITGETNSAFDLGPGEAANFTASVSSTTQTAHTDTARAIGSNIFSGANADDVSADSNLASCSLIVVPELGLTKVCDPAKGSGSGVELELEPTTGLVVAVHNVITVTNPATSDENIEVTVSDDMVAALVESGSSLFTCTAATAVTDAFCTGTLGVNQSATFKQSYRPTTILGGSASNLGPAFFRNTATANATGVLSGSPTGQETAMADCELCPTPAE